MQEIIATSYPYVITFWIAREKSFSVEVRSWFYQDPIEDKIVWNYNVYAYVFKTHPLHKTPELCKDLPLSGGCTYDRIQQHKVIGRSTHDWNKPTNTIVVGSDYAHIWDVQNHESPLLGIPSYILRDAIELKEALQIYMLTEAEAHQAGNSSTLATRSEALASI